jgi:hypothetical protein
MMNDARSNIDTSDGCPSTARLQINKIFVFSCFDFLLEMKESSFDTYMLNGIIIPELCMEII